MKISVCMAAYNGERYIKVQIESILNQLGPEDQLVIVDDKSTDSTVNVIRKFEDTRINLIINQRNMGVVQTFNRALKEANGEIIFLSDQDDRWHKNKIEFSTKIFSLQNVDLIVHNALVVRDGKVADINLFEMIGSSSGIIKNIYKNTFTGCCMAFKRNVLQDILPIPTRIGIFHDAWIGVMAQHLGYKVKFVSTPLIDFNRHGNNASSMKRRNIIVALYDRILFILALTLRIILKKFI